MCAVNRIVSFTGDPELLSDIMLDILKSFEDVRTQFISDASVFTLDFFLLSCVAVGGFS